MNSLSLFTHETEEISLSYWEVVWFEQYSKNEKNIFELVRAADFWNINTLLESLVAFIAKELLKKHSNELFNILFNNKIHLPHRFSESVLFQILLLKTNVLGIPFYNDSVTSQFFRINNFAKYFINHVENSKNNFDFNDFAFIYNTVGMHIIYDPSSIDLSTETFYPKIKWNLEKKKVFREILDTYVDTEDLTETIIAGGIFLDYQNDSLFAEKFPDLFNQIQSDQDIDVFLLDNYNLKFEKYYLKIFDPYIDSFFSLKRNKLEQNTDSDEIYEGIHSFKIKKINCPSINFIFINKKEYSTLLKFLDTFDFSVSKTYYSYESDSVYLPIQIFKEYRRICDKFGIQKYRCMDINWLLESPSKFCKYYNSLIEMLNLNYWCHNDLNLLYNISKIRKKQDSTSLTIKRELISNFMNANNLKLRTLSKCPKMFYRILKYSFKNYFEHEKDLNIALRKIVLFYSVLQTAINDNCFTKENLSKSIINHILEHYNKEF